MTSGSLNVISCMFLRYGSCFSGNGGAIYVVGDQLSVSECTFSQCSACSGKLGGALYADCTVGITMKKTCSYKCSAGYGHFYYVEGISSSILDFELISIVFNGLSTSGNDGVHHNRGLQTIKSTNSSKNHGSDVSCFVHYYPASLLSVFSTFQNNTSSGSRLALLDSGTSSLVLSKNNFINNVVSSSSIGIFEIRGSTYKLEDCIIHGNNYRLFYVSSGSLQVNSCFILHNGVSNYGSVSLSNVQSAYATPYQNEHYVNMYCPGEKAMIETKIMQNRPFGYIVFFIIALAI